MNQGYLAKPVLPNFARFRHLFYVTKEMSLTRALQYEKLEQQKLWGTVLDVGGGENSSYRNMINSELYHSINIDNSMVPTWEVEVGEAFPCPHEYYDFAISLNTFEHIFDVQFVLNEIHKALKPGGSLVATMPFLYPIHAHPDDFARLTPSWFDVALNKIGYKEIEVIPLSWGPFSTGMVASSRPGRLRKNKALFWDLFYAKLHGLRGNQIELGNTLTRHALAFFIRAVK